jgi:thiamine pyrophosphokinase
MSVPAIGDTAAKLTHLALIGQRFDITLQEKTGNDWSFSTIVLKDCVITSAGPTAATISGAPQAQFSGFSMHVEATDAENNKTVSPPQSGS